MPNILYTSSFIKEPNTIYSKLLELNWLSVTEARMEYFMSDIPRSYTYGNGLHAREYVSNEYSKEVLEIQNLLNKDHNANYNVCFLNRYNNQRNQLGWHADDSPSMDFDHPISVVSFGAEREIWWKLKGETGIVPTYQRQKLENGSLFIMPAGFQRTHFHRIPRADREVGVRISLTFRKYI